MTTDFLYSAHAMRTTPKPKTKTRLVNFLLAPEEKKDMDGLQKQIGADAAVLLRLAIRILDERAEPVEKIDVQTTRSIPTAIYVSDAEKSQIDKLAKRNKCTKSDVIRWALRALRDRGLRFG